jgi:NADPH-dependent 2,4-dienoyl-CoA reductase/sulfur reductase-like enzyme/Fe-S-cluster-containing hydrogenase component 2
MRTLFFNRDRCLACLNCELACSVVHSRSGRLAAAIDEEIPPRRRVTVAAGKDGIEALRCEQCLEPLCAFSCKSGAIHRDPFSGRTLLDESRCVACYMCLMVCPYGVRPDPARDRVVRCDVCEALDVPACVAACPSGALIAQSRPDCRIQSEFDGHVVVVGSSAAGIAACEAAREVAPDCSITLVTSDDAPEYSRPLLPYVLAGRIGPPETSWRADGYLENELKVRVLRGRRATGLKPDAGPLALDDGTQLTYDRLILATGARPAMLSIPGAGLAGVCSLRNLEDLEEIDRLAEPGRRAVVLGGGNVGLQACEALLARGMKVTVVVASPWLLSQMVDAEAGRRVGELFIRHGLNVRTGRDAAEISGTGLLAGLSVHLDNGEQIDADLVVVGKGIKPNIEWLAGSGIQIGRGIVTDLCGRTNIPGIFAAGDCAEAIDPLTGRSSISGIWPVAYETGRAAGSTAVGMERPSGGALRMNASRFFEVPVISIGEVRPERLEGATAEVLADREGVYRKLVHHQGRLAGAILYGDISDAGVFYRRYRAVRESGEFKEPGDTPGELYESNTLERPQACPQRADKGAS